MSKPDCQLKLQKLKDIDTETHSVLSETKRRYSTYSLDRSEHSCFVFQSAR